MYVIAGLFYQEIALKSSLIHFRVTCFFQTLVLKMLCVDPHFLSFKLNVVVPFSNWPRSTPDLGIGV